tara:strand:+ start:170 stop:1096 length:927 start_codon:yes stop_codon:yes gene_type:complete
MDIFSLQSLEGAWNGIWFTPENISTWIIFKYIFLSVVLFNVYILFKDRHLLYGVDNGGLAIRTVRDQHTIAPWPRFCIWDYFPEKPSTQTIILGTQLLACITALLGFLGWIPFVLIFLIEVSRIHRNIMCNHGGDTYARLLLFVIMFAFILIPQDVVNSGSLGYYLQHGDWGIDNEWAPWPLRCIMLLWVSVYVHAGMHKLKGPMWRDGTASFYPLFITGFRRFPVPHFMLRPVFIKIGTYGTIGMELCSIFAIVPDFRFYVVWAIVVMHLIFDYCINIQLFSIIMIAGCAVWITPDAAHNILMSIGF